MLSILRGLYERCLASPVPSKRTKKKKGGVTAEIMNDKELIKKLARRIHNQRVALRENDKREGAIWAHKLWTFRWHFKQIKELEKAEAKLKIIEQRYFA